MTVAGMIAKLKKLKMSAAQAITVIAIPREDSGLRGLLNARSHYRQEVPQARKSRNKWNGWGAPMTTIQAVVFGVMLASTPSLVLLAFLLWREGGGLRSNSEFDGQRPYPKPH
ncbi:MAG TPA: hypothetical protein VK635_13990 [Bradyrhizobium sp.]|jgi:hypothetical protein|nr:hypothetical protein [Bradyrhizobium sp.]